MSTRPLYTSRSTVRSLWQEYRIHADHLEFDTLFGTMIIPFVQIERASIVQSDVKGALHGDLRLRGFRPALKLDWANFLEHVEIDKSGGIVHRVLFTPEDPAGFVAALEAALADFAARGGRPT